jgi:hypothetical protein
VTSNHASVGIFHLSRRTVRQQTLEDVPLARVGFALDLDEMPEAGRGYLQWTPALLDLPVQFVQTERGAGEASADLEDRHATQLYHSCGVNSYGVRSAWVAFRNREVTHAVGWLQRGVQNVTCLGQNATHADLTPEEYDRTLLFQT